MDNVTSVEHVSPILDVLKKTNQVAMILTTRTPGVVRGIAHPRHLQLAMPGFATWEAKRYFKVSVDENFGNEAAFESAG